MSATENQLTERYRFGLSDYQYFDYPLPPLVQMLRDRDYPPLVAIANISGNSSWTSWQRLLHRGEARV